MFLNNQNEIAFEYLCCYRSRFISRCPSERLRMQHRVLQVKNNRIATTSDDNIFRELIRESLKCDLNDDFDEVEMEQCHIENVQNWWYGCLGDYCGATLPEGVCAEKCIPPLEEGIALCDGKISKTWPWRPWSDGQTLTQNLPNENLFWPEYSWLKSNHDPCKILSLFWIILRCIGKWRNQPNRTL